MTLHYLFEELRHNLKITGCIENLNGQMERYLNKVKRWHHSPQRHWWWPLALLESESRMRRITGYEDFPKLRPALQEAIPERE